MQMWISNRYRRLHTGLFFALQVRCEASLWINPQKINPGVVFPNPLKETLSDFLLVSPLLKTHLRVLCSPFKCHEMQLRVDAQDPDNQVSVSGSGRRKQKRANAVICFTEL